MNFKHWLTLNEISAIVSAKDLNTDKIRLYHGTSTGENNERIESFIKQGAKPIGSGHGQGGGFYVSNKLGNTKAHALSVLGVGGNTPDIVGIFHSGKPMVVVLELDQIDFHEWDFDAELMSADILTRAAKMLNKMPEKTWKGNLSPQSADYLKKDSGDKEYKAGEIVSTLRPRSGVISAIGSGHVTSLPYPGGKYYDKNDKFNTGDARVLSRAYQAHQDSSQGRHEKLEAAAFRKMFDKKIINIKYTGTKPLPVSEILVFDNNEWKSVYKA